MQAKNHVVIVEDSPAIGFLLKNYLEKLGYHHIHTCDTGAVAMATISDLISQNQVPIVLLDYMLPDMDAHSLLTQILEKQPDIRVILETATEKSDEGIKDLIRLGVCHYIEKPIRFENLKLILNTIEKEASFFLDNSDSVMNSNNLTNDNFTVEEQIENAIINLKQASVSKIEEIVGKSNLIVKKHLEKLENDGKIIPVDEIKEIACNSCNSTDTEQRFFCPSCKSSDFKLGKLIEHYECGNISDENSYEKDLCPNCKKEIKALGVDHRVMQNHYICNECNDFHSELSMEYVCLKCDNKFPLEKCKWKTSKIYKVVNM
ncbi:MAG: response regulator [Nitrosopumilus sp.]|nr:response regulator [Nitrosopumilus sp.]NNL59570.1 response regulator [Nitrosopumilus sp.]